MDSDKVLSALDTYFEDSGSEYNPDDHDKNNYGGNTTPTSAIKKIIIFVL
jgi:hypothetical protein